jgi:hypothetical protein
MSYLLRFEGGAVDGEGEHDDKANGDEPIRRHRVQKNADNSAKQEHKQRVNLRRWMKVGERTGEANMGWSMQTAS